MDPSILIKIFEFFKNIPQKILWVLLFFPVGIEILAFDDSFNNFLNEYSFVKNIIWLTSIFSLLFLIFTGIEIAIGYLKKRTSERKQQEDEELKKKEKEARNLKMLLNLSNKSKYYLLLDFYCDQKKEHRIAEKFNGEKYGCYDELIRKNLVLMLQKNFNYTISSWEMVCRISPEAIEILKKESIHKKVISSLPKEWQEHVIEDISMYEETHD